MDMKVNLVSLVILLTLLVFLLVHMHGDPDVLQLSPGSKMLEDPDGCSGVIP